MTAIGTRFTDQLWSDTEGLRKQIDDLEFLRRLGDGTLPIASFHTYIEQDALYLQGYAKALAILASRSPDPATGAFWAKSSAETAVVETALHSELLPPVRDLVPSGALNHSQVCLGYVSYLIATAATAPYCVAAAAALPCFWIYADVGQALAASAKDVLAAEPDHPYARWVTTYDAPEFQASAAAARQFVDAAADSATEADREAMSGAFEIASRYELLFWDTALHPQPWPAS